MAVISSESRAVYSLMTGQKLAEPQGTGSMMYLDGRCEIKKRKRKKKGKTAALFG